MNTDGLFMTKFVTTELRETNMEDHNIIFIEPLEHPYVEYAAGYYVGKLWGLSTTHECPLEAAAEAMEMAAASVRRQVERSGKVAKWKDTLPMPDA